MIRAFLIDFSFYSSEHKVVSGFLQSWAEETNLWPGCSSPSQMGAGLHVLQQCKNKTSIWKVSDPSNVTSVNFTDLQFLVYHPFQLVSTAGKEQTQILESCCSPSISFTHQPSLFVLEVRLMVLEVTKHQRPKNWTSKCSQCKTRHLNAFCESVTCRGQLSNTHEALWTINYTENQQDLCCQNFRLLLKISSPKHRKRLS